MGRLGFHIIRHHGSHIILKGYYNGARRTVVSVKKAACACCGRDVSLEVSPEYLLLMGMLGLFALIVQRSEKIWETVKVGVD